MARGSGSAPYSLVGLVLVFLVLIVALPVAKAYLAPYTGGTLGFSDLTCKDYAKPCPEGYFCQQEKCTAIFPRM
jgi:hypothetical protein